MLSSWNFLDAAYKCSDQRRKKPSSPFPQKYGKTKTKAKLRGTTSIACSIADPLSAAKTALSVNGEEPAAATKTKLFTGGCSQGRANGSAAAFPSPAARCKRMIPDVMSWSMHLYVVEYDCSTTFSACQRPIQKKFRIYKSLCIPNEQ